MYQLVVDFVVCQDVSDCYFEVVKIMFFVSGFVDNFVKVCVLEVIFWCFYFCVFFYLQLLYLLGGKGSIDFIGFFGGNRYWFDVV